MKKPKKKKQRKHKPPKPRRRKVARSRPRRRIPGLGSDVPMEAFVSLLEPLLDAANIPIHISRTHVLDALGRRGYLSMDDPAVLTTGAFLYAQACEFGRLVLERFPEAGAVFRTPPWWFLPPLDGRPWSQPMADLLVEDELFRYLRPRWETRVALMASYSQVRREFGGLNQEARRKLEIETTRTLLEMEGSDFLDRALDLVTMAAVVRAHDGNWRPAILQIYTELQELREGRPSSLPALVTGALVEDVLHILGGKLPIDLLKRLKDLEDVSDSPDSLLDQVDDAVTGPLFGQMLRSDRTLRGAFDEVQSGGLPIALSQSLSLRVWETLHRTLQRRIGRSELGTFDTSFMGDVLNVILQEASPGEREVVYDFCREWIQHEPTDPRTPILANFVASRCDEIAHRAYWMFLVYGSFRRSAVAYAEGEPRLVEDGRFVAARKDEYVAYLREQGLHEAADWVAQQDFTWVDSFLRGEADHDRD